ncbi:MAG: TonB-dependent receptor, partial [Rubrivivax sp.]|nr:TonB-dependent receptor [Rubrivivax sp.]
NRALSNPALVPPAFSVTRDPATGGITNVVRGAVNEGNLHRTGFDLTADLNFKLGGWGKLESRVTWSQTEKYTLNGGRNLVGDQGVPKYRIGVGNTWSYQRISANLALDHIAAQPGLAGFEPSTKAYTTADIALTYRHPTKTQITVGMRNLEGKLPELLSYDGRPWNFNLYDGLGRTVYFRLKQEF